ncbi:CHAP domain-containing protein [Pediococcus parvulus]|uniref:CHAP domain-containing protein n=1 Tax=Pediococcus parvulus TaxID=54062 RepID=A0AAP5WD91_9LACO|nr:CHAP domain-containing protein [Pediococcus parvulus]
MHYPFYYSLQHFWRSSSPNPAFRRTALNLSKEFKQQVIIQGHYPLLVLNKKKGQQIKADSKPEKTAATSDKTSTAKYSDLISLLKKQLGKSYVYGAVGPDTFDCSGLTQYIFKNALNKTLPRTAQTQYNAFDHVSHSNVKPGDLVFFSYNGGATIDHVGIVVSGDNQMIDAQDRGVIKESYMASYWKPYIAGYAHVTDLD